MVNDLFINLILLETSELMKQNVQTLKALFTLNCISAPQSKNTVSAL